MVGVSLFLVAAEWGIAPMGHLALAILATQAGFLCLAFAGATWRGAPARAGLGLNPPKQPLSLPVASGFVLGTLLLSFILAWLLESTDMVEDSTLAEWAHRFAEIEIGQLPYFLIGIALLPAIAEELLFRGFLFGRLSDRFGPRFGLLGSSILFGAAHLDLMQGLAAFGLGLYLGGVRLRTGSVHVCILCHASNNTLAILAPRFLSFP